MPFDPEPAISVLQLRISLRGLSPAVWRRVLIPEHITLGQLHAVIQVVMGWTDEHLHQFTIRGRRYGEAHEGVLHSGKRVDADRIWSERARGLRLRV